MHRVEVGQLRHINGASYGNFHFGSLDVNDWQNRGIRLTCLHTFVLPPHLDHVMIHLRGSNCSVFIKRSMQSTACSN